MLNQLLEFEVSLKHGIRYRFHANEDWRYYKLGPIPKKDFPKLLNDSVLIFDSLTNNEPKNSTYKMTDEEFNELCGHNDTEIISQR